MRRARTATPAGRRLAPHPPEGSPERLAAMSRAERNESFAVRQLETRLLTLRRKAERTDAQTKRAEEVADIHDQQVAESRRAAAYRDRVYTEEFVSRRSHVANEKKAKDAARSMMVSHFNDRQRAADEARSERQRLQTIRVRGDEDRTAALRAIAKDDRVQLKESLRRSAQMMQRKNLDAFADGEARRDELRKAHSERMSEEQEQRARTAARVRSGRAAVKQAKDALERRKHEERNGVLQQLTETKRQTTSELQRYRERLEEERRALEAKVRGQPR